MSFFHWDDDEIEVGDRVVHGGTYGPKKCGTVIGMNHNKHADIKLDDGTVLWSVIPSAYHRE